MCRVAKYHACTLYTLSNVHTSWPIYCVCIPCAATLHMCDVSLMAKVMQAILDDKASLHGTVLTHMVPHPVLPPRKACHRARARLYAPTLGFIPMKMSSFSLSRLMRCLAMKPRTAAWMRQDASSCDSGTPLRDLHTHVYGLVSSAGRHSHSRTPPPFP